MSKVLLASVHDVSPRFEDEVEALIDVLRPHAGNRIAMLVVPNHWGDTPIVPGSPFAAKLRHWADAGFEMFLHGYYHRDDSRHAGPDRLRARWITAGEGEFLGLPKAEAIRRIERGRARIEDVTGRPIAGFVAPAWLYGTGAFEALAECSIPLAENHWRVWSPTTRAVLAYGLVITWASRSPLRLASSIAAAAALRSSPQQVLRVGVHPADVAWPAILRSINKTLEVATRHRRPARYSEIRTS